MFIHEALGLLYYGSIYIMVMKGRVNDGSVITIPGRSTLHMESWED